MICMISSIVLKMIMTLLHFDINEDDELEHIPSFANTYIQHF